MIIDSLMIMLLGMVGIFVVMGVIFLGLVLLHRFKPGEKED